MDLPLVDRSLISGCVQVTDDEASDTTRSLARLEGVFAGYSSGANVAAALSLLAGPEKGNNIAITINDSGLKYLSTGHVKAHRCRGNPRPRRRAECHDPSRPHELAHDDGISVCGENSGWVRGVRAVSRQGTRTAGGR